ncbi:MULTISPECIES: cysteine desulfurase [unclassified Granulicatella]|uniref:cysteine desulfurase n=1 Tax=unclassified Granulicatella TaxID=2630493 RepID=UPI00107489F3|nr:MULTISPECIES: cysteine desulfurase [unclassified Granulicatella]MBF0779809.1 cysteine desulfurase [Granulicatella sp. 19428wC4_WM01]TFU96110.1 cysteine desulfurase [Granulicatella sp. WM01]
MSFSKVVFIKGLNKSFTISPKCKKYTLRDNGFEETKAGSFQLVRYLDAIGSAKKNCRLKVSVSKDLTELKISTTTANGLTAIDLYKMTNNELIIEKFEFTLDGLVDRDVLVEVSE